MNMTDKAFAIDPSSSSPTANLDVSLGNLQPHQQRWDQDHIGLAFKFGEDKIWHCVWATLAEYDDQLGTCVFRSYHDVYLEQVQMRSHNNLHNHHKNRNGRRHRDYHE